MCKKVADTLNSNLFYSANETDSISYWGAGVMTGSNKVVYLTVPVTKHLKNISTITISSISMVIRQNNSYLFGTASSSTAITSSNGTISVSKASNHSITLQISFTSSIGGTNNDAVGVYANFSAKFT